MENMCHGVSLSYYSVLNKSQDFVFIIFLEFLSIFYLFFVNQKPATVSRMRFPIFHPSPFKHLQGAT